jgi:hypothetical protein
MHKAKEPRPQRCHGALPSAADILPIPVKKAPLTELYPAWRASVCGSFVTKTQKVCLFLGTRATLLPVKQLQYVVGTSF